MHQNHDGSDDMILCTITIQRRKLCKSRWRILTDRFDGVILLLLGFNVVSHRYTKVFVVVEFLRDLDPNLIHEDLLQGSWPKVYLPSLDIS